MTPAYSQTREESAAPLKRVLAEMGPHDAPLNPATFAVWYEHLAGINPSLSMAFKQAREGRPRPRHGGRSGQSCAKASKRSNT